MTGGLMLNSTEMASGPVESEHATAQARSAAAVAGGGRRLNGGCARYFGKVRARGGRRQGRCGVVGWKWSAERVLTNVYQGFKF